MIMMIHALLTFLHRIVFLDDVSIVFLTGNTWKHDFAGFFFAGITW